MNSIITVILIAFGLLTIIKAQTFISGGLTCAEKQSFLDAHNLYRTLVANGSVAGQPPALNMQRLVWDDKLEIMAQNWANNMTIAHSPPTYRIDRRWWATVGENIAFSAAPKFSIAQAVKIWFDENTRFTFGPLTNLIPGHYTQLVWGNTIYVGCGQTRYVAADVKKTKYLIYVCNYGPSGNWMRQYVYKNGTGNNNLICKEQCNLPPLGSKC